MGKKLWVIGVCAVLALSACAKTHAEVNGTIRVIDGDTLDVGATRVRLHGIDAPEADQTCRNADDAVWNCGAWVSSVVRNRFQGETARCEMTDRDRYGRVVARCFVLGVDVAEALVQDGLAFAYRRYALDYVSDEVYAAKRTSGLHASKMQSPERFRQSGGMTSAPPRDGCAIKGNVSSSGTCIYHRPGQRDYDVTRISAHKGERWFCSAVAAEAAGWRAAKR